ncbi:MULTISPECIES: FAD/NAD(P)-binding protein [unclassified Microbacterium]|uniref:FAD/NAD(P)-binding protein n=1 Tax=unclassified Microbacterium TaxID=2609290 RepID=UPI003867FB14
MTEPVRLVFVGAGPRATMLLERITARLSDRARLEVTLVDPHPPGAGRLWRADQSPLLALNSMARDVTVFTDDTCTIAGPVRSGPSLIEWAEQWRGGGLPDAAVADPAVRAELHALRGDSFPSRRLQSAYLEWFFARTVASAPAGVSVRWVQDRVVGVSSPGADAASRPAGHPARTVHLAGGDALIADAVIYCVGHTGRDPDPTVAGIAAAAGRAGLTYVAPDFTADADLSGLVPGADVAVRGMGLAAVDLVVLLTQGRGGRFDRDADGGLRYRASGREPRLHLGSRRGVPYRSKVSSTLQGDAPAREVLTPEAIAALLDLPRTLDFDADVWPLVRRELLIGHYRELFTGHPGRVTGHWPELLDLLRRLPDDSPAVRAAVARAVPDPRDRLDVDALDRPLAGDGVVGGDVHERVYAHIAEDLALRTSPEHSATGGLFFAILLSFLALADIPPHRWNARSRAESLPGRWHTFFSYVASGPPAFRLEELLALADAGVVRFLGPDIALDIDAGDDDAASAAFSITRQGRPPLRVRALVDAWLPAAGAAVSDDPALRELATRHGVELAVRDEEYAGTLGRVHVDPDGRVLGADGTPRAGLYATGPFTAAAEGGAFSRPRSDALAFRQIDRVAGAIVAELVLPEAGGSSDQDAASGVSAFSMQIEKSSAV